MISDPSRSRWVMAGSFHDGHRRAGHHRTGLGHSSEGKLLLGQLSRPQVRAWLATGGRSFWGQPPKRVSADYRARPAARSFRCSGCGQVVVDLAGDVALEDPDDLGFGLALFDAPGDVGLGAGSVAHAGDHDDATGRCWLGGRRRG